MEAEAVAFRRHEGSQVAVETGRVPASRHAVERVGTGPDRLVRLAGPVRRVVAPLVPGPRPIADLVAVPAGVGEAVDSVMVLGCGPVLVLDRPCLGPPAARAGLVGRWSPDIPVIPSASGSSSVRAYSERWSGSRPSATSSDSIHVARELSGTSYSRSMLTDLIPASRAAATASATSPARCRRPRRRSSSPSKTAPPATAG